MMRVRDFNKTFAYELRDFEFATGYLQACLEHEGFETFLTGLKEVARANEGLGRLAEATSLSREDLNATLSARGNPEFRTLEAILGALGMRFAVVRTEEEEVPERASENKGRAGTSPAPTF